MSEKILITPATQARLLSWAKNLAENQTRARRDVKAIDALLIEVLKEDYCNPDAVLVADRYPKTRFVDNFANNIHINTTTRIYSLVEYLSKPLEELDTAEIAHELRWIHAWKSLKSDKPLYPQESCIESTRRHIDHLVKFCKTHEKSFSPTQWDTLQQHIHGYIASVSTLEQSGKEAKIFLGTITQKGRQVGEA